MTLFLGMAVNPMPLEDTGNEPAGRNWLALATSGIILASHGMTVPKDTPNQPTRPDTEAGQRTWAEPRYGWAGATIVGYPQDVARGIMCYDYTPGDPKGYVLNSPGHLWPFGSDTPMAATGLLGAPFGIVPLNPTPSIGTEVYNCFEMHSANGLPFGLGGWPDGFGWLVSMEGFIVDWGGPIPTLTQPLAAGYNAGNGWNGTLGSGLNRVRDFKVNPDGSGQFAMMYDSGFMYMGCTYGATPRGIVGDVASFPSPWPQNLGGYRWMHVDWGFADTGGGWIIAMHRSGDLWGYQLVGGSPPPPVGTAAVNMWYDPSVPNAGSSMDGVWLDGDIVPGRNPTRFYILSYSGRAIGPAVVGDIQALNPGFGAGAGTTPTETTRPTLTWSVNELLGATSVGAQKSFSVRVYPVAVTLAPGFVIGQSANTAWSSDLPQVVESPGTGSNQINNDLLNGGVYVAYVKYTSTALIDSVWNRLGGASGTFTVNIQVPSTPTSCVPTVHQGTWSPFSLGNVTIAAGGGVPPAGTFLQYQVSVEGGAWIDVLGAEATTSTTVTHTIAPTNQALQYRVRRFKRVPGKIAGQWAFSSPAVTLLPVVGQPQGWRLIDPYAIGGPTNPLIVPIEVVADSYTVDRVEPRGEFQPMTADYMIVSSAGVKGTIQQMTVRTLNKAQYQALWGILGVERSIILQTVLNEQYWVRCTPGTWKLLRAGPQQNESTPIRNAWEVELRLVQTKPQAP